jgi:hypothetical protein
MWEKTDRRSNTIMVRGGSPAENLPDIFEASEFAKSIGLTKKDAEWAYVSYCVDFTTKQLLKTKREVFENATTRSSL